MREKYRLSSFVLFIMENSIEAVEYVYLEKKGTFREISYQAEIDKDIDALIIKGDVLKGSASNFTEKELFHLFQELPVWSKTRYYIVGDTQTDIFLCCHNIRVLRNAGI